MLLKTNQSHTVNNYPYGRLKCEMTFSVEFKKGKGFRAVRQSVNPKTGRINNPKKSTYQDIMVLDVTDGFAKFKTREFYKIENFNDTMRWLSDNFDLFSPEEIKHIYALANRYLSVTMRAKATYCNAKIEDMKPLMTPAMKITKQGYESGENIFGDAEIDVAALKATEEEGYSPFKAYA